MLAYPTIKQHICLKLLDLPDVKYVVYGGAAGGGKSWLGCQWILFNCIYYPRSRWFIGRAELKKLRFTSLKTFFKVADSFGYVSGVDYHYNSTLNTIHFPDTQAEIILMDLAFKPSDPEYSSFGSLEFTGGFIDEAGEIDFNAFDTLKSRIGRQENKEQNIPPRILMTCNPIKNWLYQHFYQPYKKGKLMPDSVFIPSLPSDNPHLSKTYREQLNSISNPIKKARLMLGDWEYDDSSNELFNYQSLLNLFTNAFVLNGKSYISIDAARMGSDKAVLIRWSGFRVLEIFEFETCMLTEIVAKVNDWSLQYAIPRSQIICDEDGVGGGVVDMLQCIGFQNNKKLEKIRGKEENYANLKAQCYYRFARRVNNNEVFIVPKMYQEEIIKQLDFTRRRHPDGDGKLNIISKEEIKRQLGHSPDYADALIMREYFELNTKIIHLGI